MANVKASPSVAVSFDSRPTTDKKMSCRFETKCGWVFRVDLLLIPATHQRLALWNFLEYTGTHTHNTQTYTHT